MVQKVKKRDGRTVLFDKSLIRGAITKAMKEVGEIDFHSPTLSLIKLRTINLMFLMSTAFK